MWQTHQSKKEILFWEMVINSSSAVREKSWNCTFMTFSRHIKLTLWMLLEASSCLGLHICQAWSLQKARLPV